MGLQDLKASLLFPLKRLLIRVQLLVDRLRIKLAKGSLYIPEDNCHPIVPAAIFCTMKAWRYCVHLQDASHFHLLLQDRVMILLEQPDEFVRKPPPGFVVVFNYG